MAKARLKRFIVAIPILGSGATLAFEASEFKNWQAANPQKHEVDYLCENASLTIEIFEDVIKELPENLQVSPEILGLESKGCERT